MTDNQQETDESTGDPREAFTSVPTEWHPHYDLYGSIFQMSRKQTLYESHSTVLQRAANRPNVFKPGTAAFTYTERKSHVCQNCHPAHADSLFF